jgi:triacylglycerol lipase
MRRVLIAATLIASVLLGTACETIRPTGTPSGRTPVVFVHGWNGSETMWATAVDRFEAAGYTSGDISVIYYDSALSAQDAAAILATEVDHLRSYTGESRVDIVSHSYGSMVTRYCVELGGCAGKVDHWMSLAGADNGTSLAGLCAFLSPSCADMSGQSTTIAQLQAAWPQISALGVEVEVQWTPNDGVILPATNSQNPAPAVNIQVSGTLTHNDLPTDPGVLDETLDFFAG